jgi:hypothetical protein
VNGRLFRTVKSETKLITKNSGAVSHATFTEDGEVFKEEYFCDIVMFLSYRPYEEEQDEYYLYVGEFYQKYKDRNMAYASPVVLMDRSSADGTFPINKDSRVGYAEHILPYAVSYYQDLHWTAAERQRTAIKSWISPRDRIVVISDGLDGSPYNFEKDVIFEGEETEAADDEM